MSHCLSRLKTRAHGRQVQGDWHILASSILSRPKNSARQHVTISEAKYFDVSAESLPGPCNFLQENKPRTTKHLRRKEEENTVFVKNLRKYLVQYISLLLITEEKSKSK